MMSVVQANLLCGYEVRMIREWKIVQSPRTQKSYGIFTVSQQLRLLYTIVDIVEKVLLLALYRSSPS